METVPIANMEPFANPVEYPRVTHSTDGIGISDASGLSLQRKLQLKRQSLFSQTKHLRTTRDNARVDSWDPLLDFLRDRLSEEEEEAELFESPLPREMILLLQEEEKTRRRIKGDLARLQSLGDEINGFEENDNMAVDETREDDNQRYRYITLIGYQVEVLGAFVGIEQGTAATTMVARGGDRWREVSRRFWDAIQFSGEAWKASLMQRIRGRC